MLQWGVIVEKPKGLDEATTDKLAKMFTEGVSKGFLQDVEIWKHKTRIDNPLLVEEDGAVYQMRRWYQQFYVDVADVTPDMTDRFEIEVDTTAANEKWHVEVEENLKRQAERERQNRPRTMSPREQGTRRRPARPVDAAAARRTRRRRSRARRTTGDGGSWSKAPDFASDPDRAAAVREATQRDRERYLTSGLVSVDCRFCHVDGQRQEARPRTHVRAVEHRSLAALCVLHRDPGVRRRVRPHPVVPEARRQHQTRCRRRLSGGSLLRPLTRRRLIPQFAQTNVWA